MNWVKIEKDRPGTLPPIGEKVLIFDKWGHVRDRELRRIEGAKGWVGEFFTPDGLKPGIDVTHWVKMPELPERRKSGGED